MTPEEAVGWFSVWAKTARALRSQTPLGFGGRTKGQPGRSTTWRAVDDAKALAARELQATVTAAVVKYKSWPAFVEELGLRDDYRGDAVMLEFYDGVQAEFQRLKEFGWLLEEVAGGGS